MHYIFRKKMQIFRGLVWAVGAKSAWMPLRRRVFEHDYRGHNDAHRTYKGKDAQSASSGVAGQKVDKPEGDKRCAEQAAGGSQRQQTHLKEICTPPTTIGAGPSPFACIHKDRRQQAGSAQGKAGEWQFHGLVPAMLEWSGG